MGTIYMTIEQYCGKVALSSCKIPNPFNAQENDMLPQLI
jgi:hypothetical protein